MFPRFDTIPACDGRTDRQTDRRTDERICCSIMQRLQSYSLWSAVKRHSFTLYTYRLIIIDITRQQPHCRETTMNNSELELTEYDDHSYTLSSFLFSGDRPPRPFRLFLTCINTKHQTDHIYTVSKNDTDGAQYNFNAHQPILVIFGRDVAERVCYQKIIWCPTSPN